MIPPLKGWTFESTPEGAVLTKGRARIAYVERRRPLLRLVDMIAADRRGADVTGFELTTTDEGEYGAIIELGSGGTLGYVLLDDFCAVVDGRAADAAGAAEVREAVRALVAGDSHMLGVRRRRFQFQPPEGWRLTPVGLFHAQLVCGQSEIVVFPALPLDGDEIVASLLDVARHGDLEDGELRSEESLIAGSGLRGARYEIAGLRDGRPMTRELVILECDRYAYAALLSVPADAPPEHRAAFRALARSIEMIPRRRGRARAAAAEVLSAWAA